MAPYRELWEGRMDRLGAHLESLKKGQDQMPDSATQVARDPHLRRSARAGLRRRSTDPEQVTQWWGPEHFDVPRDSVTIDLREGGRYDLTMVDTAAARSTPSARRSSSSTRPELLVLRHEPMPEHGMLEAIDTRIEFHDEGGATRVEITERPLPAPRWARTPSMGWEQQLDKLAGLLSA